MELPNTDVGNIKNSKQVSLLIGIIICCAGISLLIASDNFIDIAFVLIMIGAGILFFTYWLWQYQEQQESANKYEEKPPKDYIIIDKLIKDDFGALWTVYVLAKKDRNSTHTICWTEPMPLCKNVKDGKTCLNILTYRMFPGLEFVLECDQCKKVVKLPNGYHSAAMVQCAISNKALNDIQKESIREDLKKKGIIKE